MRRSHLVLGTALLGLFLPGVTGLGGGGALHAVEACAPAEAAGGEWPTFGADLANTRSQPAETSIGVAEAASLAPSWTFTAADNEGRGGMTGTPVVSGGCAFVATDGGDVYALNADTGGVVWHAKTPSGGGINSTLAVDGGRVFGLVSRSGSPYAIALDAATGALLWETTFDTQPGSDTYSSPVVFNGLVFAGVSGAGAETAEEAERYAFQGAFVLLDAATGAIAKKTWVIHEPAADGVGDGYAGAAVWSTPSVDVTTGFAYVGAGNPFQPQKEHEHANAVLKIDLRPDSTTWGEIVDSYKGDVDEFFPVLSELPCGDVAGNPPPWYPQGVGACADIDLDFGASPNLFTGADGKLLVGAGQKSGVYHAFDRDTMAGEWKTQLGAPGMTGGIVGTASVTGHGIAGPVTQGGYMWSVGAADGALQWAKPTADGAHYAHQTSSANGVVYTMDLKGFLQAYDEATGDLLLHTPIGSVPGAGAGGLGGGVAIARNTVYAPGNGVLSAFTVGGAGGGGGIGEVPDTPDGVGPVVATGPGGFALGYATPVVVARAGGSLTYINADVAPHDVVSDEYGPGDQPWCRNYPLNKCPMIWSNLISLANSTPVLGLDNAVPGATYTFTCSLHPNMQGTLVISPA